MLQSGVLAGQSKKLLYPLAVVILLAAMLLSVPAAPVQAAVGTITNLAPTAGSVGTQVNISGSGFTASSTYTITMSGTVVSTYGNQVSATGTITDSFTVPTIARGAKTVSITTSAGDTSTTATFTITPKVSIIGTATGNVGDSFNISGNGFTASATVTILFDDASAGTVAATATGSFSSTAFTVPEAPRGSHNIKGQDTSSATSSPTVSYTITPKITATPITGAVGDTVTLSGSGYAANSAVTVYFGNLNVTSTTANTLGSFTGLTFAVPSASRGSHTLRAQDAGGNAATATYTVGQKMTINAATGVPGTSVSFSGSGFGANQAISITFNSVAVTTSPAAITSSQDGSFAGSFAVPGVAAGTYAVAVSDGTYSYSLNFTIVATTNLSVVSGDVGEEITMQGSGFAANAVLTITYDTIQVATGTVAADGSFSIAFTAPASAGGEHTLTATDGVNSQTATFTMESTAPAVPEPVLPLDEGKIKALGSFEWTAVEDPSGVTYDFEIASDPSFAVTMIVLQKTGLTETMYTLLEEEELVKVKKEAPYYWRVRAIDGASNASEWAAAQWFTTGFIFEMPGWLIYLLYGLGALLLGIIGFWVGRRTAYY